MDRLSQDRRSWNMGQIRGTDTKPEIIVRSYLHREGLRFRLHERRLPGRPDIVLKKYRAVVFVHGCFWHRHPGCKYAYTPKSRVDFWAKKFADNVRRDAYVIEQLQALAWRTFVVWECQVETETLSHLVEKLRLLPRSKSPGA